MWVWAAMTFSVSRYIAKHCCVGLFSMLMIASNAFSETLEMDGSKSYEGNVTAVVSGYWNHVGVQLDSGVSCNGRSVVMLRSDNPNFEQSYAILLAAKASNQKVHLGPTLGPSRIDEASKMCLVDEVSLGKVRSWSAY